jgi:peptidyl-prolyl cis-trans isomerase SurA
VSSLEPSIFFVLDELEPGEISEPMEYETPEGQKAWRVIRLDSRTNAHKANLKDDYQMIKQYAESIEQQNVMSQWVDSKILDTYLRIDEGYMGCDFGFKWHQQ